MRESVEKGKFFIGWGGEMKEREREREREGGSGRRNK